MAPLARRARALISLAAMPNSWPMCLQLLRRAAVMCHEVMHCMPVGV